MCDVIFLFFLKHCLQPYENRPKCKNRAQEFWTKSYVTLWQIPLFYLVTLSHNIPPKGVTCYLNGPFMKRYRKWKFCSIRVVELHECCCVYVLLLLLLLLLLCKCCAAICQILMAERKKVFKFLLRRNSDCGRKTHLLESQFWFKKTNKLVFFFIN
jgi:hypothetical protein